MLSSLPLQQVGEQPLFGAIKKASKNPGNLALRGGSDRSTSTAASMADSENPVLSCPVFPRFDAIKAEHVVPGIKKLIGDNEKMLSDLEEELKSKDYKMDVLALIEKLEVLGDELGSLPSFTAFFLRCPVLTIGDAAVRPIVGRDQALGVDQGQRGRIAPLILLPCPDLTWATTARRCARQWRRLSRSS